jgi:hypothetical protein
VGGCVVGGVGRGSTDPWVEGTWEGARKVGGGGGGRAGGGPGGRQGKKGIREQEQSGRV